MQALSKPLDEHQSVKEVFVAERAYEHVSALCYPRRVGTPAERRAARYIAGQLHAAGLTLIREPFRVSFFSSEMACRILFTLCAAMVVAGGLLLADFPWLSVPLWGVATYLVRRPWRFGQYLGNHWPPYTVSENLVATAQWHRRDACGTAPARVVFMAHYDTKSQFLPTGIRVGLVTASTGLCALLTLLALVASFGLPVTDFVPHWRFCIVVIVLLAGLIANYTGNRSPGALDNGSGVGTLLELARSWRPQPDAPVEVVFVATGSEEAGLNGAYHFRRKHAHWWQEKPTLLINLESVGAGPRVYLAGGHQILHWAEEIADELGLRHARLRALGAGMDHEPFSAHDLPSLSILGDVVQKSLHMHSARDNLRLIERAALERAGRFAGQLAWCWAEIHQPASAPDSATDISLPGSTPSARMRSSR